MMRQAALQRLRSTNRSKLSRLFGTKPNTASKLISPTRPYGRSIPKSPTEMGPKTMFWAHHFCTSSVDHFTVRRSEPELVRPAKPTPGGLKPLSNLDDQQYLRMLAPFIQFYRYHPSMHGKDPAKVVRDALAHALVFYYPLAGRLTEGPDRKLSVDCTGEGVWFAEADADVELQQLGDPPRPPFPWHEQLFHGAPAFGDIINQPLIRIQVTRLKCGGFIVTFMYCHIMSDGSGLAQFFTAVGEIARRAHAPSIMPIWRRELFKAPDPLPVMRTKCPEEKVEYPAHTMDRHMVQRSFFFGPSELLAIRRLVPDHERPNTTIFEILTTCFWRCRTVALEFNPEDVVHLNFVVNARDKTNHVVPVGYYGNAFTMVTVETSVKQLCQSPLAYAVGLVKKAKKDGTKVCMSWRMNPPETVDQSVYYSDKCFVVTDTRRAGLVDVDFGWGKAAFAGFPKIVDLVAIHEPFRNHKGEDGILISLALEDKVMVRFEIELASLVSYK